MLVCAKMLLPSLVSFTGSRTGNDTGSYGLWDGVGAMDSAYSFQLLICDTSFYSGSASSFPVTLTVTSSVTFGVEIGRQLSSVQRPLISSTTAWLLTPIVMNPTVA